VTTSVRLVVLWAVAPLPPTTKRGLDMHFLQRAIVATCVDVRPPAAEQRIDYFRRRSRLATECITTRDKHWRELVFESSIAWREHMQRDWAQQLHGISSNNWTGVRTNWSWAPSLQFHDHEWLAASRTVEPRARGSDRQRARTNTRSVKGLDGTKRLNYWGPNPP
jgi:hypothetical protein